MNIISNTCLGAYLYNKYGKEYTNPFCWNIIDYDSLCDLIVNYNYINFKNIKAFIEENTNFPTIIIDDLVKIKYVHYKDKAKQFEIEKNSPNENNVYLENCVSYAINKYNERLLRMTQEPIFIIQVQPNHPITGNIQKLNKILNLKTIYKIVIFSNIKLNTNNNNIINIVEENNSKINQPATIANIYYKTIQTFL